MVDGQLLAGLRWPMVFAGVFAAYALGSVVAFRLLAVGDLGAVLFLPAGLMVGALVLARGFRLAVLSAGALAEVVMDVSIGDFTRLEIAGYALANTIGPLVATLIMVGPGALFGSGSGVGPRGAAPDLARRSGMLLFAVGAVAGTFVSAAVGSGAALGFGGRQDWKVLLQWWLGDLLGVILIGGFILARVAGPDRRPLRSPEAIAFFVGVPAAAVPLYWLTDLPMNFVVLLPAMSVAIRFGTRATSTLLLLVAAVAIASVTSGSALLGGVTPATALIMFKIQYCVFALAGLYVAAESFERERAVSRAVIEHEQVELLQQALLPSRHVVGRTFSAEGVYEAASERLGIGGDWYEVVELRDGRVFLCVGDVVGHGTAAVVAMGRLRFAIAAAADMASGPNEVLDRMDDVVNHVDGARFTTVWVGIYDQDRRELLYSSAGHPPALLRHPDGAVQWLDEGRSVPLGMATGRARPLARISIDGPTVLLVFTDGAVERPGESLDVGLARLAQLAATDPHPSVKDLLDGVREPSGRDDSVLLRVELAPQSIPDPISAQTGGQDPEGKGLTGRAL